MIPIVRNSRADTKFGIETNEGVAFGNLEKKYKNISESARIKNREAIISSLLMINDDAEDCSENFIKEDIKYEELAMLSDNDLELLGIKSNQARIDILETLKEIQNQEKTFDEIIKHPDAQMFNKHIFDRASDHLSSMSSSMALTNYKLRFNPSNDVIVEEKYFASKYVAETLDELKKVTTQINRHLKLLEKYAEPRESKGRTILKTSAMLGLLAVCVGGGVWVWKRR